VDANQAFVSGLLHDVGVITLLSLEGGAYEPLVKSFGSDGALLVRAERFHFGFDHTTLGAACLRRWELPEPICAVVERHHTPQNPQPRPVESQLLPVLRLSDHLARAMNRVRGAHELADSLIEHEANRFLGLEPRDAADLAGMLRDDRAEVRHFV